VIQSVFFSALGSRLFHEYHRDRVTHPRVPEGHNANATGRPIRAIQAEQTAGSRQRRSLQLLYNLRRYGPPPTANASSRSICVIDDRLASTCRTVSIPRCDRTYAGRNAHAKRRPATLNTPKIRATTDQLPADIQTVSRNVPVQLQASLVQSDSTCTGAFQANLT